MNCARPQICNSGPLALSVGVAGAAIAQLFGGAPLAAATALCTWAAARIASAAGSDNLRPAVIVCASVALLAICAQLDLALRAAAPAWRAVLVVDAWIAAAILGSLLREAVRR